MWGCKMPAAQMCNCTCSLPSRPATPTPTHSTVHTCLSSPTPILAYLVDCKDVAPHEHLAPAQWGVWGFQVGMRWGLRERLKETAHANTSLA